MMRIFFDTEFPCAHSDAFDMISAGFVAENGDELYLEIADFDRDVCSPFVVDTVLPLLNAPPENIVRIKGFGPRLAQWLGSFNEPIELVCDFPGDRLLIQHIADDAISNLPHTVKMHVWKPNLAFEYKLSNIAEQFWSIPQNKSMQHHALFDARCLKHTFLKYAGIIRHSDNTGRLTMKKDIVEMVSATQDKVLEAAKRQHQETCRVEVRQGVRSRESCSIISPELAKSAKIHFPWTEF